MPKATKILLALLFGAIFGGIGAGASYVMGKTIRDALRAESWVKVRADVDAYKRGGAVSYRYSFGGAEYKGDRMGAFILGGRDNLDDWYGDMDRMLRRAVEKREPITVYVNPDNPQESMIDHTLRWKLIAMIVPFAVGFGGVGIGAVWVLLGSLFTSEAQPATWTPGSPAPPPRRSSGLGGQWAFTIMWNAIAIPIAFIAVPGIWQSGEWIGLIVLIFPLIGALMLWGAISSTISAIVRAIRSPRREEAVDLNALAQAARAAPPPPQEAAGTVFARGMISEDAPRETAAEMVPATISATPATAAAFDPDALAPAATVPASDAELERFEKVLKQGKLDAHARAELAKLPPAARKLVMLGLQGGSWIPKIIVAIVVLIIVADFLRSFF